MSGKESDCCEYSRGENLHDSFEERFERAMQFHREDKTSSACDLLVQLLEEQPKNKVVLGMLSICHFELEQYELAAKYAQRSVIVSPASETASLILFHSLWKIEQHDEAFAEMKRFTARASSAAYDELLHDISRKIS